MPAPRYLLIAPTWIPRAPGDPCELLGAGTEIRFDGVPGSSLAPMDPEAAKRVPRNRAHMTKMAKRFRRQLSRQDAARLAAAEAEMGI